MLTSSTTGIVLERHHPHESARAGKLRSSDALTSTTVTTTVSPTYVDYHRLLTQAETLYSQHELHQHDGAGHAHR